MTGKNENYLRQNGMHFNFHNYRYLAAETFITTSVGNKRKPSNIDEWKMFDNILDEGDETFDPNNSNPYKLEDPSEDNQHHCNRVTGTSSNVRSVAIKESFWIFQTFERNIFQYWRNHKHGNFC